MTVINTADKVYLGSQQASAIYAGTSKVWPPWTVGSISGLSVWLDASQLTGADGSPVTSWPNLAGSAPSAILGAPAPRMSVNKLKGQRLVRFTVSEGRVRVTNTGVFLDYTVIYIARMLSLGGSGSQGRVLTTDYPGDQGNNNWLVGFHTAGYDWFYDNGNVNVGSTPWDANGFDVWKLYGGDSNSGEQRFFINGVLSGDRVGSSGVGPGGRLNLSGYAATEETCDFEIAEVILYNRRLSDADRQTVENYLRDKWLT